MKRRHGNAAQLTVWTGAAVLLIVMAVVWVGLARTRASSHEGQIEMMQTAIERAAVQCYALEGAYPPDVQYLTRYGIDVDESLYIVTYETYGSNIRPYILVLPAFKNQ